MPDTNLKLNIDPTRPGVALIEGGDIFAALLIGTRARRIVACVNACAGIPTEMLEGLQLGKPTVEAWCSVDSCSEYWGWEPVNELDERTRATLDPLDFRTVFVARKPE